jgi:hypothetical protein
MTRKSVQENNVQRIGAKMPKSATNWNDAIYEAKRMLKEERKKVAQLVQSIKSFERLRDEGMPFPGTPAQEQEPQP